MRKLIKMVWWFTIVLIVLPIAVKSAWSYAEGWPRSWNRADWSSSFMLPDARDQRDAVILIMAARSGRWKSIFAVHHWIVVKPANGDYERFDVVGWGSPVRRNNWAPDSRWYSNEPQIVHRVTGRQAAGLIPRVRKAVQNYRWSARGSYFVWPGPNSNSFVADVLRKVPELGAEMLPTGIGKDYLGRGFRIARTPSGTGWQFSLSGFAGAALAWREGFELHVLGATIGIDPDDLSIKLPAIGWLGARSFSG